MRPAKTQISLGIRPVWSESSLSAWRNHGSLATHSAHSEDSEQTGRMPRLIWVFAGCTLIFCWFCHVVAHMIMYFIILYYIHQKKKKKKKNHATRIFQFRITILAYVGFQLLLVTWSGVLYHVSWMSSYHRITFDASRLVWSRVILWYELIHSTRYGPPDQVTVVIMCKHFKAMLPFP